MILEPLAWIAAAGAYLAVTAVLAMDTPGEEKAEILHPRYWIWLPLMGLLVAAPRLSGVFTLMLIAHYLGVFPEAWIVPGLFVFWTVLMIYLKINTYRGKTPKRRGVLSLKSARAATLRSAPASPAPQPSAVHAGTPATTDGAAPISVLPPDHASLAAGDWDDGSSRAAADSAACREAGDSAPAAADAGCAGPTSSSTSHSWYGGDDSSDSGGGDSD